MCIQGVVRVCDRRGKVSDADLEGRIRVKAWSGIDDAVHFEEEHEGIYRKKAAHGSSNSGLSSPSVSPVCVRCVPCVSSLQMLLACLSTQDASGV